MSTNAQLTDAGRLAAVLAAYAVQGLGYAVVVTAVPSFQARLSIDSTIVSIVLLGVCVAAAAGSVLADRVAVVADSRRAVQAGFVVQAVGLAAAAVTTSFPVFVAGIVVYGIGLGCIDAASSMQGVLAERRLRRPVLGRCFAAYTVGAICGAVVMSLLVASSYGAMAAILVAALATFVLGLLAGRLLDPSRAATGPAAEHAKRSERLPSGPVVAVGLLVLAAFTIDAAISTWSSVHLIALGATMALAPVGYALYQAAVLASRLATDSLSRRFGAARLALAATLVGVAGAVLVALFERPAVAIAGFAASGLAVGVLVPVAFGFAGRIRPARSDEVVARVNLFNYPGAVFGAVGVGLLIDSLPELAFLVPAAILLAAGLWALRGRFRGVTLTDEEPASLLADR